jgi:hypothetical protein
MVMVYVLLTSGECVQVEAVAAGRRRESIVCTDAYGQEVRAFPASDVEVFTRSERQARALRLALLNEVDVPAPTQS